MVIINRNKIKSNGAKEKRKEQKSKMAHIGGAEQPFTLRTKLNADAGQALSASRRGRRVVVFCHGDTCFCAFIQQYRQRSAFPLMGQSIKDGNETMVGEREKLHATEKRSFPHTNQEVFVWGRGGRTADVVLYDVFST